MELESYGFVLLRTGPRALEYDDAESDPSVEAGRMAVEVMTWWTPKGTIGLGPA